MLPVFLSEEDQKSKGDEIKEFRSDLFKKKYLSQVKPFPGVRDLFLKIRANGQQRALASSAKGDELGVFAKIARVDDLVDTSTSSADAEKSKPHPDIFEAALAKLGRCRGSNRVWLWWVTALTMQKRRKEPGCGWWACCAADSRNRTCGPPAPRPFTQAQRSCCDRYEETPLALGTESRAELEQVADS